MSLRNYIFLFICSSLCYFRCLESLTASYCSFFHQKRVESMALLIKLFSIHESLKERTMKNFLILSLLLYIKKAKFWNAPDFSTKRSCMRYKCDCPRENFLKFFKIFLNRRMFCCTRFIEYFKRVFRPFCTIYFWMALKCLLFLVDKVLNLFSL